METVFNIPDKILEFFIKKEYLIPILISLLCAETITGLMYVRAKNETINTVKENCSTLLKEKNENINIVKENCSTLLKEKNEIIKNLNSSINEQRTYFEKELNRLHDIMIERRAYNKEVENYLSKKGKIVENILESISFNLDNPEYLKIKPKWLKRVNTNND